MSWQTVPICDDHWEEEMGERLAYRIRLMPGDDAEICYREGCGVRSTIYVRRDVPKT